MTIPKRSITITTSQGAQTAELTLPEIYNLNYKSGVNVMRVDRGTEWGNPFLMHANTPEERNRVCDLFTRYATWRLSIEPDWLAPLEGKTLGCWCAPKRCHAETLVLLANGVRPVSPPLPTDFYVVKSGDCLTTIAERAGLRYDALLALNPQFTEAGTQDASMIFPGEVIVLRATAAPRNRKGAATPARRSRPR